MRFFTHEEIDAAFSKISTGAGWDHESAKEARQLVRDMCLAFEFSDWEKLRILAHHLCNVRQSMGYEGDWR